MTEENPAILVEEFRQILLWPFVISPIHPDGKKASSVFMKKLAEKIDADSEQEGWVFCRDGLDHIADDGDTPKLKEKYSSFAYQEFVYFHDFVARFLYGPQDAPRSPTPMRAFYLFRRQKLKSVEIELPEKRLVLHVARCNLYLFRTGIAILALEVSSKDPRSDKPPPSCLPLDDVLCVSDVFRRVYTPFFDAASFAACAVPTSVTWHYYDGTTSGHYEPRGLDVELDQLTKRRNSREDPCDAPLARHWSDLLPRAFRFAGDPNPKDSSSEFRARHILDERMAVMTYIRLPTWPYRDAVQTLESLSEADFMRLCFVDQQGKGFPYYEKFLQGFDETHAYDRFRGLGTRHLFTSYSYVMVCAGDFAKTPLVHHFRRMYFQMALIAYMEYATYIAISSQVSAAIEAAEMRDDGTIDGDKFRDTMFLIQRDFLDFVHRFRFASISNQIQAMEMYEMFRNICG